MSHPERPPRKPNCPSCGLSLEPLTSLELTLVHQELHDAHAVLSVLKPALITAAYYLSQYAHHLHESVTAGASHPAELSARETHASLLARDLMEAYSRTLGLLSSEYR